MQPRDLVARFLTGVGRRSEAELYLRLFRAERPESFAIIAADDVAVRDAAEAIVLDLVYLARLDLRPVTLVSRPEHAHLLREWVAEDAACEVVADAGAAIAAIRRGALPILAQAADALPDVAAALGSRKVVLLGGRLGLTPIDRPAPSIVDIRVDYDDLIGLLPPDQAPVLERARALIEAVPQPLTVAVTSPFELLRELFTVRGAGTLVVRGAPIARHPRFECVDRARLSRVIASAFGAAPPDALFAREVSTIYIAGDYQGAAIVTPSPHGSYLSKFAVDRAAQGEGVGRDLWRAIAADHPALYWRAREDNPIAPWYQQQCEGLVRRGPWTIYWRGIGLAAVPAAVDAALSAPKDFPA